MVVHLAGNKAAGRPIDGVGAFGKDSRNPATIPQASMSVKNSITRKLTEALDPSELEVVDESARHAGHAGARAGGESHFAVVVVAECFTGKSRVERHRMVNQLLAEEIAGGLHALSLKTLTPSEKQARA